MILVSFFNYSTYFKADKDSSWFDFRMEFLDLDHCDIYSQVAIDLAGGLPWCGGKVQTSLTHSCLDKNLKDGL